MEFVKKYGKKWAIIAKKINGRNENGVKNRFNSLMKREGRVIQTKIEKTEPENDETSQNNNKEKLLVETLLNDLRNSHHDNQDESKLVDESFRDFSEVSSITSKPKNPQNGVKMGNNDLGFLQNMAGRVLFPGFFDGFGGFGNVLREASFNNANMLALANELQKDPLNFNKDYMKDFGTFYKDPLAFQPNYHQEENICKRETPQNKDSYGNFTKEGMNYNNFTQDNWGFHNTDPHSYLKDFPQNFTNLNVEIKINNPISFPNVPSSQNMPNFQTMPNFQNFQNFSNLPNISHMPNLQTTNNANLSNFQNLNNMPNMQNLPNMHPFPNIQPSPPTTLCFGQPPLEAEEKSMSEESFSGESSPVSNIRELLNCLQSPTHSSFEETCSHETKQMKETSEIPVKNPINLMFPEEKSSNAYFVRNLDAKTVKAEKAKGNKLHLALINYDKKEIFLCPKDGSFGKRKRKAQENKAKNNKPRKSRGTPKKISKGPKKMTTF